MKMKIDYSYTEVCPHCKKMLLVTAFFDVNNFLFFQNSNFHIDIKKLKK